MRSRQRVRRDRLDALGDRKPFGVCRNDERREPARAGRFAGAGEHDIDICNAAVGNPRFLAVDHKAIAVRLCGRRDIGDIGARRRFVNAKAAIASPTRVLRSHGHAALGCRTAISARRPAPAWRRRNRRVLSGAPVFRERVRACGHRAGRKAPRIRRGMLQPAVTPERSYQRAACCVNVVMRKMLQIGDSPRLKLSRERAMARFKKWPRVKALVRHQSISRKAWQFLRHECVIGALEIPGLHADRLCLCLGFDGLLDRHRPFLVEHGLGHHVREGRSVRELFARAR